VWQRAATHTTTIAAWLIALATTSTPAQEATRDLLDALERGIGQPPGIDAPADLVQLVALSDPAAGLGAWERGAGRWACTSALLETMTWEWRHQHQRWGLLSSARSAAVTAWSQPIVVSPILPYAAPPPGVSDDPAVVALDHIVSDELSGGTTSGPASDGGARALALIARRIGAAGEPVVLRNLGLAASALMEAAWSRSFADQERGWAGRQARWAQHLVSAGTVPALAFPVLDRDRVERVAERELDSERRQMHDALTAVRARLIAAQASRDVAAQAPWRRFWRTWNGIYGITPPDATCWQLIATLAVPRLIADACAGLTDVLQADPPVGSGAAGGAEAVVEVGQPGRPSAWSALRPLGDGSGPALVRQVQDLLRLGMPGTPAPASGALAPRVAGWCRACAALLVVEQVLVHVQARSRTGAAAVGTGSAVPTGYEPGGTVPVACAPAVAFVHSLLAQGVWGGPDAWDASAAGQLLALLSSISAVADPLRSALLTSLDHGDPAVTPGREGFDQVCAQVSLAIALGTQAMAGVAAAAVSEDAAEGALADCSDGVLALLAGGPPHNGVVTRTCVQQQLRLLRIGWAPLIAAPSLLGMRATPPVPGVDVAEDRLTDLVAPDNPTVDFWVHACLADLFPKLRAQDHRLFLLALAQDWCVRRSLTALAG
jgi:hypothetical protein